MKPQVQEDRHWRSDFFIYKIWRMLVYALTVFSGAFLLFQIQPLLGKYLLPWFGGGPSVWTTCLFFFQAFLVAGYAYAHGLARYCRPRAQMVIHLGALISALAFLPVVPAESWKPHTSDHPSLSILLLLTANVGLPYLVLASTGPLLQSWSSRSGASPYWLYAVSNLGSLLALFTYPLFVEVHWSRKSLAIFWAGGLVFYSLGCGWCAVRAARQGLAAQRPVPTSMEAQDILGTSAPSPGRRLLWLLWPACASVLLMAVTNKLCLDVAVFPLLWVLPLGFYVLSFIICFAGPKGYWRLPTTLALAVAMVGFCWALFQGAAWPFWKQVCVYTGGLFICCLVCHGELFRIRPEHSALTDFYLMIALGGALGGLFVSLVAPAIFTGYFELHWGLIFLGLLLVMVRTPDGVRVVMRAQPTTLARSRLNLITRDSSKREWARLGLTALWLSFFGLATVLWLQSRRADAEIVHKSRNFYGVLTVFERRAEEPNGHHLLLQHGRITHGFQFVNPQLEAWPTTYFGPDSGVGLALNTLPAGSRRVGVVGLGVGTIASYAKKGDYFRFYEINPQVSCLATSRFSNLAICLGNWDVTLGDARLSLEREVPQLFDLLALDAFNSDSIPIHLLTREAFELYLRHLKPSGILAVHTSNHFLNLEPVIRRLALHFGLQLAVIDHDANPEQWWIYSSTWVLLSRDQQVLDTPKIRARTKSHPASQNAVPLWTDDFSSLFQILK